MNLGVGIAGQRGPDWAAQSIAALQPALWCNWLDGDAAPGYLPMAYYLTQPDRYIAAGQANQRLWLCGNEPELADGRATSLQAAEFARRWADEVGGEWAGFGCIVDSWGYDWLDDYIATGGPIPTHWHIHIYYVATVAEWQSALDAFVVWMRRNRVTRPVIVSETCLWTYDNGVPGAVDADEQMRLLDHIVVELERNELLHACLWYSDKDYHGLWPWSDLRRDDGELTELGAHFAALQLGVSGQGERVTTYLPGVYR